MLLVNWDYLTAINLIGFKIIWIIFFQDIYFTLKVKPLKLQECF